MNDIELVSANKSFGGWMKRYRHRSQVLHCDMVFGIYLPPQADQGKPLPVLYWLSGLTCTDENFMQKAGAQRLAAEQVVREPLAGLAETQKLHLASVRCVDVVNPLDHLSVLHPAVRVKDEVENALLDDGGIDGGLPVRNCHWVA